MVNTSVNKQVDKDHKEKKRSDTRGGEYKKESKSHADKSYLISSSSSNTFLKKSGHSNLKRNRSRSTSRDRSRKRENRERNYHETSRKSHPDRKHHKSSRRSKSSSSSSSSDSSSASASSRSSYSPKYFNKINEEKKPQSLRKPGGKTNICL